MSSVNLNWSRLEFQKLIDDSKYVQELMSDDFQTNQYDIIEILNSSGKVYLNLLYDFYTNKLIEENDLYKLFISMHYLDCKRITELYCRIHDNESFVTLSYDIQREINNYVNWIEQIDCTSYDAVALTRKGDLILYRKQSICLFKNVKKFICDSFYVVCIKDEHTIGICHVIDDILRFKTIDNIKLREIKISNNILIGIKEDNTLYKCHLDTLYEISLPDKLCGVKFIQIECSDTHSVGIREDGTVVTWGNTIAGNYYSPSGKFTKIACGDYYSVGIREDGMIISWSLHSSKVKHRYKHLGKVIQIACDCSPYFICVKDNGEVVGFYYNNLKMNLPFENHKFSQVVCYKSNLFGITYDGTCLDFRQPKHIIMNPKYKYVKIAYRKYILAGITQDGTIICENIR